MNIFHMMMLRVKLSKVRMLTMSMKTSWQQEFETVKLGQKMKENFITIKFLHHH